MGSDKQGVSRGIGDRKLAAKAECSSARSAHRRHRQYQLDFVHEFVFVKLFPHSDRGGCASGAAHVK